MKLNKLFYGVAAASLLTAFAAAPAQAAVLDAWQMTINSTTYTDIGRLSLTAGSATVEQEVSGGNVFVGADFTETAVIYVISLVSDNVVGPTDSGPPVVLNGTDFLKITLSPVTGHVTSLGASGFSFVFDTGSFLLEELSSGDDLATGSLVGVGGTLNNTQGFAGANGESVIDIIFNALFTNGFDIKDSTGTSLAFDTLLFEAHTNNQIGSSSGPGACTFDATANCLTLAVNSNGDAFLQTVPEPATLALLALGLLGMGAVVRRRTTPER